MYGYRYMYMHRVYMYMYGVYMYICICICICMGCMCICIYIYVYVWGICVQYMYKDRFIITDNTIWVLNFSPSIIYLGRGFNVFSKYEH